MKWPKATDLPALPKGGIRRRLLIWGLALLGLALVLNTLAGSYYTRRVIHREAGRLQTEVASRVAEEIEEFIRDKVDRLSDLAASASLHELGSKEQRLLALLLLKNDRSFTEVSVMDRQGVEVVKVADGETPAFASPQKRTRPDSLIFSDGEAEPASGLSGDGVRYVQ